MDGIQKIVAVLISIAITLAPFFILFASCGITTDVSLIVCAMCVIFVLVLLAIVYGIVCYIIDKYITSNLNRR